MTTAELLEQRVESDMIKKFYIQLCECKTFEDYEALKEMYKSLVEEG